MLTCLSNQTVELALLYIHSVLHSLFSIQAMLGLLKTPYIVYDDRKYSLTWHFRSIFYSYSKLVIKISV